MSRRGHCTLPWHVIYWSTRELQVGPTKRKMVYSMCYNIYCKTKIPENPLHSPLLAMKDHGYNLRNAQERTVRTSNKYAQCNFINSYGLRHSFKHPLNVTVSTNSALWDWQVIFGLPSLKYFYTLHAIFGVSKPVISIDS